MQKRNNQTEEKILAAAREIFFTKGIGQARMQEIADKANINKAMLHYYFRSKNQLFEKIFEVAIIEFVPKVTKILANEALRLDEKIDQILDFYIQVHKERPKLPAFMLCTAQMSPQIIEKVMKKNAIFDTDLIRKKIQKQLPEGMKADFFVLDLISLAIFPLIARPMVQNIFGWENEEYNQIYVERKNHIKKMIMSVLK